MRPSSSRRRCGWYVTAASQGLRSLRTWVCLRSPCVDGICPMATMAASGWLANSHLLVCPPNRVTINGLSAVDTVGAPHVLRGADAPATEPRPFSRGYLEGRVQASEADLPATEPRPFSRGYGSSGGGRRSSQQPATEPRPFSRGYFAALCSLAAQITPATEPRPFSRGYFTSRGPGLRATPSLQLSHGLSAVDTGMARQRSNAHLGPCN